MARPFGVRLLEATFAQAISKLSSEDPKNGDTAHRKRRASRRGCVSLGNVSVDQHKYRPEIDGLRAIAVVPVIFFYAGFEVFQGGFIGVDIFFVISGYLITSILISEISDGTFSILNFYERRARRILPALFLVMMCCLPFAWIWMQAREFNDFAQSFVAVSFFASNILFWRQSNYFSAAAEEKPLLHTWSLAVEEQFYILFPLFLLLALRFGRNPTFWAVAGMAGVSLALAEWGSRNYTIASFYLLPTRAWELFAGSLAALYLQGRQAHNSNLLAVLGLLTILVSIVVFDKHFPLPSLLIGLPVLGTVLIILFTRGNTVAHLLGASPFVSIGLISYSVYLWHQPLLAFARVRTEQHPLIGAHVLFGLASFPLAYLSWKYVEAPFRSRHRTSRRGIARFSVLAIVAPASIGAVMIANDGLPSMTPGRSRRTGQAGHCPRTSSFWGIPTRTT